MFAVCNNSDSPYLRWSICSPYGDMRKDEPMLRVICYARQLTLRFGSDYK